MYQVRLTLSLKKFGFLYRFRSNIHGFSATTLDGNKYVVDLRFRHLHYKTVKMHGDRFSVHFSFQMHNLWHQYRINYMDNTIRRCNVSLRHFRIVYSNWVQ